MGHAGSVLCHCLYAWAVSYGLDERGMYDGPDISRGPIGPVNLMSRGDNEIRREQDRQRHTKKLHHVVRTILREIDDYGIMRRPSWDGVRSLLLIIPLTEGASPPTPPMCSYYFLTPPQAFALRSSARSCTRLPCRRC